MPRRDRDRFVHDRCGGHEEVEQRVRELLAASSTPDEAFSGPFDTAREALWRDVIDEDESSGEDLSGQAIDEWRLVRRLARGGLATVYLAHREDGNFEQKAAFKVLRRGLDTDDVIRRFRAERQILSTLEHPSIARILDGGSVPDGRPYLVLEYVDGVPITRYCDENGIDINDRIKLLMQVLQAIHHAHKHLIVHRDVKPSNVLVSAEGHAALLDFGISKLLDPAAVPDAETLTLTGVSLLTPGYGSPEQCRGEPVTTASDIYQMGLLMYELVTGKRPFDTAVRTGDEEPELPSRVLRDTALSSRLVGDLDAIICKAMHIDPSRRYASAMDMHADLGRYLDDRPIQARPDSLRYRMSKLARRRPWLLPGVALSAVGVAAYLITLTTYTTQLRFEKGRAQEAEAFMVNLLRSPDPFAPADPERGSSITVVEALELGVARLRADPPRDPKLRASLLASVSGVYASLDQPSSAIPLRTEALELEQQLYGFESRQVLESLEMLGVQFRALQKFEEAGRYHDRQLIVARSLYEETHPQVGSAQASKAAVEMMRGDRAASQRLYDEAVTKMRSQPQTYSRPLINALVALSGLRNASSSADAGALLEEARRLAGDLFGPDSLSTALINAQAGTNASDNGDFPASEMAFSSALAIYETELGPDHGATMSALNNLGVLKVRADDLHGAEKVFREIVERYSRKDGRQQGAVAGALQNLGTVLGRQGRFDEAIPLHREAFELFQAVLPSENERTAYPLISVAYAELQLERFAAAEHNARQALDLLEASGAHGYASGVSKCLLALAREKQGAPADGAILLAEARAELAGLPVAPNYRKACRL